MGAFKHVLRLSMLACIINIFSIIEELLGNFSNDKISIVLYFAVTMCAHEMFVNHCAQHMGQNTTRSYTSRLQDRLGQDYQKVQELLNRKR